MSIKTSKQNSCAKSKNKDYFLNNIEQYASNVQTIDTYKNVYNAICAEIEGLESIIDIGAGGVFDYDTSLVAQITAIDLFLDDVKNKNQYPGNIVFIQGDALNLQYDDNSCENVLIVFLLHHLVGDTVENTLCNMDKAISEAYRILKPGGKFILVESCIPVFFVAIEKIFYKQFSSLIKKSISHPPTFQVDANAILKMMKKYFSSARQFKIAKGSYILQFGFKVPSWITPAQPYIFTSNK